MVQPTASLVSVNPARLVGCDGHEVSIRLRGTAQQFFEEHLVVAIPNARRLALEDFLQHPVDAIGTKPTVAVESGNTISAGTVPECVTHKDPSRVVVRGFRDANTRVIACVRCDP